MAEYTAEQVGRSELLDPRTLTKFLEAAVPTPSRNTVGFAVVASVETFTVMSLSVYESLPPVTAPFYMAYSATADAVTRLPLLVVMLPPAVTTFVMADTYAAVALAFADNAREYPDAASWATLDT